MQILPEESRAIGSLVGLAIGDAMGAPYEFSPRGFLVANHYGEGGVHGVSKGEWTDDTSMALCIAKSLIDCRGFDANDQMRRYLDWYEHGYFCTRERCFDIGATVRTALQNYKRSGDPYSGVAGDGNSGNGSLMRIAPIAIFYKDDKEALVEYAAKSSQTTHKSQLAVDACVVYAQLIAKAIGGASKEELLSKDLLETTTLRSEVRRIVEGSYKEHKAFRSSGFVLHTLESALMAFYTTKTFEEGLRKVIALGEDTDTAGAVYGQLAGAYYGYDAIDEKYIKELLWHDKIFEIARTLYKILNQT